MDYQKELTFAKSLARTAGKMMRDAFGLHTAMTWKSDHTPLTEADMAINQFVIEQVERKFPNDGVLGEEASFEAGRKHLWVVDPIDGTYPFTLGAPLSTFCLALVVGGRPVLGVVFDPYLKRMFWALSGHGAFVNNERLHVARSKSLENSYTLLSNRALELRKTTGVLFDQVEAAGGKAFNFRSFAYSSCFVAAGTAAAAVIGTPKPWDVAAATVILEEAGGKVTDFSGNKQPYDSNKGLLATNGLVHERILELIND